MPSLTERECVRLDEFEGSVVGEHAYVDYSKSFGRTQVRGDVLATSLHPFFLFSCFLLVFIFIVFLKVSRSVVVALFLFGGR